MRAAGDIRKLPNGHCTAIKTTTKAAPATIACCHFPQLFILGQWARGWFINEKDEGWLPANYSPFEPYPTAPPVTGHALDRGVLSNVLGGAFCPVEGEANALLVTPGFAAQS